MDLIILKLFDLKNVFIINFLFIRVYLLLNLNKDRSHFFSGEVQINF